MNVVVLFLFLTVGGYVATQSTTPTGGDGTCQCAAFKDEEDSSGEPLISKTPGFKVPCNKQGEEDCQKMCIALAQAAKTKVPQILCEKMNMHVEGLKPAAFYKACDAAHWTYTGLTSSDVICCHDGQTAPCKVQ